jgi:hypothetical protein
VGHVRVSGSEYSRQTDRAPSSTSDWRADRSYAAIRTEPNHSGHRDVRTTGKGRLVGRAGVSHDKASQSNGRQSHYTCQSMHLQCGQRLRMHPLDVQHLAGDKLGGDERLGTAPAMSSTGIRRLHRGDYRCTGLHSGRRQSSQGWGFGRAWAPPLHIKGDSAP